MAEYCEHCKRLQDRLDEIEASRPARSKTLLAASVYHANQADALAEDWGEYPSLANVKLVRQHRKWAKVIRQAANETAI